MMDESKSDKTKTANQAWRRKPRQFAPKSRLGCKTCKIRRVKCDLSRPSCLKCRSTGRTCDGYDEMPLACKIETASNYCLSETTKSCDSYHQRAQQPILQNLGPFMVLPVTGADQTEALRFFEYISLKHLNEYRPCKIWRQTLMFFSQTVPSVRYAALAVALIHRKNYLDRDSSEHVHPPQSLKDWLPDKAPLLYYNRAIQLLVNQEGGDSTERTAITLLVCYLFTCFEHLAGNDVQAMKHVRGGVELSHNVTTYDDARPSGVRTLICQVTGQIRRLDMQAATFLLNWTPAGIQDALMSQLPSSDSAFQSLDQAADHLQTLLAWVMRLRNAEQQMSPMVETPPSPWSVKDIPGGRQLEVWSNLFENLLQQDSSCETDLETNSLISLLRLQHTIIWILLSTYGSGREMDYDNFLPQFQQCVALAGDIAAAHERYSGSLKPTFTPEVGIVPVLYILGVKCRHPVVRRKVLSILRRRQIREAVWDSISAARVVERVIEIEEDGSGEGGAAQSMEQIAAWQRVETMSWVHVGGQSAARMDIEYTFCAREEIHVESLLI